MEFPKPIQLGSTSVPTDLLTPANTVIDLLKQYSDPNSDQSDDDTASVEESKQTNPTSHIAQSPKDVNFVGELLNKYQNNTPEDTDTDDDEPTPSTKEPVANDAPSADTNSNVNPKKEVTVEKPGVNATTEEITAWAKSVPFHEVANMLHESGVIIDIPEDFPVEDVNAENFQNLVNHNIRVVGEEKFNEGYKTAQEQLINALSPSAYEIVRFQLENPNVDEEELKIHIESILYQQDIASLDPNDLVDAEVIVRQHLSNTLPPNAIEEEIALAKQHGFLTQRANTYKPLLEQRVHQLNKQKAQERENMVKAEQQAYNFFLEKAQDVLKGGKIHGVDIGYEDRNKLWSFLNTTKVPVPVPGGKNVDMAYPHYLLAKNIYGKDANVENLLFATMILEGGLDAVKKYLAIPVKKEEVIKFRSKSEKGIFKSSTPNPEGGNQNPTKVEEKKKAFFSQPLR